MIFLRVSKCECFGSLFFSKTFKWGFSKDSDLKNYHKLSMHGLCVELLKSKGLPMIGLVFLLKLICLASTVKALWTLITLLSMVFVLVKF